MALREKLRAARQALIEGRFGEFADRAYALEANSLEWAAEHGRAGVRIEAAAMLTTLAHVAAVRDRLLALRGAAGGYQCDGSLIVSPARRLSREG